MKKHRIISNIFSFLFLAGAIFFFAQFSISFIEDEKIHSVLWLFISLEWLTFFILGKKSNQ